MLQSLKNKNIALLTGFLLSLLLSYKLAISRTLGARNEYLTLKREEQRFNNLSQQLSNLHKKEMRLDSVLQKLNLEGTSTENNLLRTVNLEANKNGLKVIDFNPPHVFNENDSSHKTCNFVLRGNFTSILKAINSIEMQSSFGEIVHLSFNKKKNFRTSKSYLDAEVFIQKLE